MEYLCSNDLVSFQAEDSVFMKRDAKCDSFSNTNRATIVYLSGLNI